TRTDYLRAGYQPQTLEEGLPSGIGTVSAFYDMRRAEVGVALGLFQGPAVECGFRTCLSTRTPYVFWSSVRMRVSKRCKSPDLNASIMAPSTKRSCRMMAVSR